jgi:uncharacterized protein (DUF885 family)
MHRNFIMTKRSGLLAVALLALSFTAAADWQQELRDLVAETQAIEANQAQMTESERLQELIRISYDYSMLSFPEFATFRGDPRGRDRWTDQSAAAIAQRQSDQRILLSALESIDRDALGKAEQTNYDLFLERNRSGVEGQAFPGHLMPINQMGGPQQSIAQMMAIVQTKTVAEYEDVIVRLEKVSEVVDQAIANMRTGMEQGLTPPAVTLRDVPQQVRNQLVDEPAASPVLGAFREFAPGVDSLQQENLRERAYAAYSESVAPAYERLLAFLEDEYLPASRKGIALRDVPNGEAWYAYNVRQRTTTDLTPEQIHEIGLSEVMRIRAEMEAIIETTGFEGDFAEFLHFLRTDPQFYHTTKEGLLQEYRDISKRADPELMKLFGHLPRTPYGVIPVPSYAEKSQTTAYYQRGSVEAGRPGYFFANTYALDTRPRWEMEALTLHEAVPGHHLQIAIQDELEDVPWFRRFGGYTAFSEGWGLYSESLGEEMGFYQDPYSKFGQLTYEMWRAVRLVVDTGMHHLGWSRQQAIDFFLENSSKSEHDVVVEIDRYIVWPGQALAYKIGELKIKELRAYATDALGEDFDIRAFHDEVLGNGAVPLSVLEANIKTWVEKQKSGS